MTSVFRDTVSGEIVVMCKGADSVLLPLIRNQEDTRVKNLVDQTVDNMNTFAKEGLRTLLIVEKNMTQAQYEQWNKLFTEAVNSISDREAMVEKCADLLEKDFDLVGSTALEDKL
jgi:magnesium-transporting ATPase (P-type)